MDSKGWSRKKSCLINVVLVAVLSLPCALGFNVLSGIEPLGAGSTILDLEDFIISNNILPLGSLVYVLFCSVKRYGWGWDKLMEEANTGEGLKLKNWMRPIFTYVVPAAIIVIYVYGLFTFPWK